MAGQRHNSNHWVAFHHKRPRPPGVHSSLMVVPQHHRSSLWPFRTVVGVADNNNNNNQQRCFSSRRTNQEEASGTTTGVMIRSVYDSSPHWEDWFSPEEYGPPYDYHSTTSTTAAEAAKKSSTTTKRRSMWLEPLEDDPSLDASSRHFIKQLQVLYHDKFNRDETITTRRCHSMIHRLLSSAEEVAATRSQQQQQQQQDGAAAPDHGKNIAVMKRQRVMRAVAILRTMELFWEFVPGVFASATAAKKSTATQQHQQRHGSNASKWPLPTYELYADMARGLAALRASKQYDLVRNADVPFVCQEILLRWNDLHKEKGMVYLKKPPVEAWNQVLLAWANAHGDRDHPEKALYATQFLLDMKTEYNVTPDASSYGHVLRACAHNDQNQIAEELGGRLAIRLWTGFMKEDLERSLLMPTSYTYVFFMRALSNVPDAEKAEYYLQEAWASVCAMGLVNEHVLSELENSSDLLFKDLLREYRDKMTRAQKVQPKTAYDKTYHRELLKLIPFEWKRRLMDKKKLLQENTGK